MQTNALAWERWAFSFAQARQLAALAPVLPTHEPQLKQSIYDMVLSSMLLNPAGARLGRACVLCGTGRVPPLLPALPPNLAALLCPAVAAEHGRLRAVVSSWPHGAYDAAALQAAVLR